MILRYRNSAQHLVRIPQCSAAVQQVSAPSSRLYCNAAFCAEDQASHLLWRLQNGEVFLKHPPKVAIVLIGTNDLGAGGSCHVGQPGSTAAANGAALRSALCCVFAQNTNVE